MSNITFKRNRKLDYLQYCLQMTTVSKGLPDDGLFAKSLTGLVIIGIAKNWTSMANKSIEELDHLAKSDKSNSSLRGYHQVSIGLKKVCEGEFMGSLQGFKEAEAIFHKLRNEVMWSFAIRLELLLFYLMGKIEEGLEFVSDILPMIDQVHSTVAKQQILTYVVPRERASELFEHPKGQPHGTFEFHAL